MSGPDERPYRFDPDYRAEALAALVWILGLALLAAHFAAGGTL